jgi:hypothetical protein
MWIGLGLILKDGNVIDWSVRGVYNKKGRKVDCERILAGQVTEVLTQTAPNSRL